MYHQEVLTANVAEIKQLQDHFQATHLWLRYRGL